jgi:GAF domain-containing protein
VVEGNAAKELELLVWMDETVEKALDGRSELVLELLTKGVETAADKLVWIEEREELWVASVEERVAEEVVWPEDIEEPRVEETAANEIVWLEETEELWAANVEEIATDEPA